MKFFVLLAYLMIAALAHAQSAADTAYEAIKTEATEAQLNAFIAAYPNSVHSTTALSRLLKFKIAQMRALEAWRDDPKANLSAEGKAKLEADIKAKNLEMAAIGQLYADALTRGFSGAPIAAQAPSSLNKPAAPAPAAPTTKPAMYALGQSWAYKKTDYLNNNAQSHYVRTVTKLLPNGGYETNDGQGILTADGTQLFNRNALESRSFGQGYMQYPTELKAGASTSFSYDTIVEPKQGKARTERNVGTLSVQHAFTLTTPNMGSHSVWRVLRSSDWSIVNSSVRGTYIFVGAYSAKHRRYLAWEEISQTHDGKLLRNERHEMVSVSP